MLRKFLLLITLVSLLLPIKMTSAAGGVTIGPAAKEVTITPEDQEVTFELTITNGDEKPLTARLKALDFKALDESGGVAFVGLRNTETETSYGLSNWLSFSKDVVTLEPGKTEKITAIVTNRDSLGPGGHYGAIVVTPIDSETDLDTNQVEIIPATATLVLAKKTGGEVYDLKLNNVSLNQTGFSLPDKVTLRFQNSGNIHVVPRGTVVIRDPFGREIQKANINNDSGVILPESFRKFPSDFTKLSKAWWPGRYKVVTSWRYDGKDDPVTTSQSFWYIGTGIYLLTFLVVLVISILWISRRKRVKRAVKP